jgi:AraC-like DNA-binding protein
VVVKNCEVPILLHDFSQIVNRKYGMNFHNLMNWHRIEEVKKKLKDPEFSHMNILSTAYESGFNSKASFNAMFKKMVGVTPA